MVKKLKAAKTEYLFSTIFISLNLLPFHLPDTYITHNAI